MMRWVLCGLCGGIVKVITTRFKELSVEKKDIITFKEGPLGFEHLKDFFIVDPGDKTLILWLQSCEDGSVAFPIIEPKIFSPNYIVRLLPAELTSLKLLDLKTASVYTILTISQDVTSMTANMKAPLVINNTENLARQIVLQDSKLDVRFPMYTELKKYIVNYSSDDSTRTRVEMDPSIDENGSSERHNRTYDVDEQFRREKDLN